MTPTRRDWRRTFYAISFGDYAIDFHVLIVAPLLVVERTGSGAALFVVAASNWLSETIFEVPTGYLADRFGRARSTAASFALRGIGFLVIAMGHSTWQFVTGWVIVGLGSTLLSGALEAWAVDHERAGAAETGDDPEIDTLLLRGQRAASVAMALAVLASIAVGSISYAAPFLVAGIAGLVLTPVVRTAMDSDLAVAPHGSDGTPGLLAGARHVLQRRALVPLFAAGAVLTLLTSIPGVQWAPAIEEHYATFALIPLGTIRAAAPALRAASNRLVEAVLLRIGRHPTLVALLATSALLLGVLAHVGGLSLIVGFVAFSAVSGIPPVLLSARLNELIDRPEHRATILSMFAAVSGLVTGLGLLVLGAFVGEPTNRAWAWTVAAAAFGVLAVAIGVGRHLMGSTTDDEEVPGVAVN